MIRLFSDKPKREQHKEIDKAISQICKAQAKREVKK